MHAHAEVLVGQPHPPMRWPLVLLSACLFMAGQTPAAAIESVPTIAQARVLYEDGLNQQAVAAAQAVLQSAPDAASQREAYRILGRAYTKMALYDAALQALPRMR